MAGSTSLKSLMRAFLLLLVISPLFSTIEARPLNAAKLPSTKNRARGQNILDGLEAIKTGGGPSPGGKGHGFTNAQTLGRLKSGLSPRGKGHGFTNAQTLGVRLNSGPSPGGKGHGFTNSQTLGVRPNSGPSPGQGH